MKTCNVESCTQPAKTLCHRHRLRRDLLGDPEASLGSRTTRGLWLTDAGLRAIGREPSVPVPLLDVPPYTDVVREVAA